MLFQRKINQTNQHLQICPFKLKISEKEAGSFRIKDDNLDESIKKSIEYLNSSDVDYVKFGVFLFRRFFFLKAVEDEDAKKQNKTFEFYIDKFLDYNFIDSIKNVLMKYSDPFILYDSFYCLIDFTIFPSIKNKFEYYIQFSSDEFLEIYKKILYNDSSLIVTNLYEFLFNLCFESEICLNKLYKSNFLQAALNKYSNHISSDFNEIIEFLHFIAIMARNSNIFNSSEKEKFFKIFSTFLSNGQSEEAICYSLIGINYLNEYDKSNDNSIINLMLNEDNSFINKLININYFNLNEYCQSSIITVLSIFHYFIEKIQSNNLLNLLNNTQILEFFCFLYSNCEKISIQLKILEILLTISRNSDINIIFKLTRNNILNLVILSSLTSYDFLVRKTSLYIIYNILSLNNFDVAADFSKTSFIDYLIKNILKNEIDKDMIKLCLEIIYCFIKSGNVLGNQNPFTHSLKATGIEDLLNKENSFLTEELNPIIEKIKCELNI